MSALTEQFKAVFAEQIAEINDIQSQLDPQSAGRAKVLNTAIDAAGDLAAQTEAHIHTVLAGVDSSVLVGVITHLNRVLKREYGSKVDEYVDANIVEVEPLAEDVANDLRTRLEQLIQQARAGRDLLIAYGEAEENLPKVPVKRGRTKGSVMGPRLKGTFVFSVDGSPVDGSKLGDLKAAVEAASVAEIRTAIETANADFDWNEPPAEFSFVVNGKNVVARQSVTDEDGDEIEDNEPEADEFDFED